MTRFDAAGWQALINSKINGLPECVRLWTPWGAYDTTRTALYAALAYCRTPHDYVMLNAMVTNADTTN